MASMRSIIYISGSGRSGSTLLERILHSSPSVTALGELHCLWRMPTHEITCSCGSPFHDDMLWQEILEHARFNTSTIAELRRLESRVCRSGFVARHRFSLESLGADPEVQAFLDLQSSLFDSIKIVSGTSVLVDSSKAGPRAWILASDPRVALVHLHRDPAEVMASWRSTKFDPGMGRAMKRMPIHSAALDWWKVEQLISRLGRVYPVARIDYQALCSAPHAIVTAMLAELGLSEELTPNWISSNQIEPRSEYHSLNGNPDRFSKSAIQVTARGIDWSNVAPVERHAIRVLARALRLLCPAET